MCWLWFLFFGFASNGKLIDAFGVAGLVLGFGVLVIFLGTLLVSAGAEINQRIIYTDSVEFSKVSMTGEDYIFEFDDRNPVSYPAGNVKFAPPAGDSSVREGVAVLSWGYWLPFDDWEGEKYIEYTPTNK